MSERYFDADVCDGAESFARARHGILIGGEWRDAVSERAFETYNPATKSLLGVIPEAGAEDVELAVDAASRAFNEVWSKLPPSERQHLLWRLGDAVEAHADELAVLETLDNGKPVREARVIDIRNAVETLRYCAGWATKLTGETVPVSFPGEWHSFTVRQPFPVVGLIVPWNAPIMMAIAKLAPALAAGCCAILKPAELTSLTALRIGRLTQDVGFPPGVINILTGIGRGVGQAIVDHPGIEKISFTGSGAVGQQIISSAARTMKKVTLELGGKSAVLIMQDADLDKAIPSAARGIFGNAGQICNAGSRIYAHRSVYDRVLQGVADFAEKLVVGNGLSPSTQMGPLVSQAQLDRVCEYVALGRRDGASVVIGGNAGDETGYFMRPTVVAQTRQNMRIVQEEIFGPVVCVQRFDDDGALDDLAMLANATEYGLGAVIWTRDLSSAHRLANRIRAGTIRINGGGLDPALPFGGMKKSGWGRESGREGVDAFTETKSVIVAL